MSTPQNPCSTLLVVHDLTMYNVVHLVDNTSWGRIQCNICLFKQHLSRHDLASHTKALKHPPLHIKQSRHGWTEHRMSKIINTSLYIFKVYFKILITESLKHIWCQSSDCNHQYCPGNTTHRLLCVSGLLAVILVRGCEGFRLCWEQKIKEMIKNVKVEGF